MQFGSMKCAGAALPAGVKVMGVTAGIDGQDLTQWSGSHGDVGLRAQGGAESDGKSSLLLAADAQSLKQKAIAADARRREAELAAATASAQLAEARSSEAKLRTKIETLQAELQHAQKTKMEAEREKAIAESKRAMALASAQEAQKLLQGVVDSLEPTGSGAND